MSLDQLRADAGSTCSLLVVSPVHNEGEYIERVVAGVRDQTRRPDVWVIIDDRSTDDTLALLEQATAGMSYVRLVSEERSRLETPDGLALALEAAAFNRGLEMAGGPDRYDYVAKLDGDIVLPPEYFEACIEYLQAHPEVGTVCGQLRERDGGRTWIMPIASTHVHGALKFYRRECFLAAGGIREQLGWDAIDDIYARMRGYETRSLPSPIAEHLRPVASADGVLRGRARHGRVAYITHFPWYWVVGRSLKVSLWRPRGMSGLAFMWGYIRAATGGTERVQDSEFRAFSRREIRARTLGYTCGLLGRLVGRPRPFEARREHPQH